MSLRAGLLALAAALLLSLPPVWLSGQDRRSGDEPARILDRYLRALYARDFRQAYRFIASADRKLKTEQAYVRERGPFSGFAAELARRLAARIRLKPVRVEQRGDRLLFTAAMQLPDAGALAPLVLDWDEERLNALPPHERGRILAAIEQLERSGGLKTIEGEQEFALVRESGGWRVFLDWASGVRVSFAASTPGGGALEAEPLTPDTLARPGEPFTVSYRVRNRSNRDLYARIVHRIEPESLAANLDILECALLLPVRLSPGETQEYASTYVIHGDVPQEARQLEIRYEFNLER
ncbi:MAG TPA: cytochrome c oxidase assembly protein [candidate division Zixibacteria bacterium]|nr:cytochrome c oxidase assembly protein [candidate division Zixibacteria bacterium]